jgi:hypothetical protein
VVFCQTLSRNTAILELKILSLIMGEAVRMGYADANPLTSIKIRRDKPAKKPELTDEDIAEIRHALLDEPEWMQISFEISFNTACQLRETRIPLSQFQNLDVAADVRRRTGGKPRELASLRRRLPRSARVLKSPPLSCIDFRESKITFPSPKGGEERAFSIPMPTAIRPLLERLANEKRHYTVEFPFQPSQRWQQFFMKVKKPHLCFHCLRVTFVNRLRRGGVPREIAEARF